MKLRNLVGERFKDKPSDCVIESHSISVRGGYIKCVANGIYSLYLPMRRITRKIENIIREEMDTIDGQEVLFPVVLPGSLWEESGRFKSVGDELLRFKDRNGSQMVLGMTHEEAAVHLVRNFGQSYAKYPFMIYQIQTKFRDEARPRAGLIRVREFTMKDAYSFHTTQDDLDEYYKKCYLAYHRIFARVGIPEVIAVNSDPGMMGGNISHEFMLLTDAGEDSIVLCDECGYSSNMEAADNIVDNSKGEVDAAGQLQKVLTPNCKSIDEVSSYLSIPIDKLCKTVIYQKELSGELIIVCLRGDYEVNETKLTNFCGEKVHVAQTLLINKIVAGFCGPYKNASGCEIVYDKSLKDMSNLCTGANEENYHYIGLNIARDIGNVEYADVAKVRDGSICPCCGKRTIHISRGIEVGNIFQLGTKYTESMSMTFTDEDGNERYPIMGCYGIGVGRLAASVCEVRHDQFGPIWPISIAPWQVHLCCLRADKEECKKASDEIYYELESAGIEVIYDDRAVNAGVMFADADLLGVPVRIIVGPKNLANNQIELSSRDKKHSILVDRKEIISETQKVIKEMFNKINSQIKTVGTACKDGNDN